MDLVYAKTSCVVAWSGGTTVLTEGQVWDARADLVKARPDLFADEPATVHGRVDRGAPRVESATRAPGERRTRPRRRSE